MKNGLFINTRKANCSIYSSGKMIYDASVSSLYNLEYAEIDELDVEKLHQGYIVGHNKEFKSKYEFYIVNYHHHTMRNIEGVNSRRFINLDGKKICIILEMNKDDPFPFMDPVGFDELLVLDPTMNRQESNIHAFPRPLLKSKPIKKIESIPEVPLIGSFGYATSDKGFELIVKRVAEEFDKANIRINLSPSTYADSFFGSTIRQNIENECRTYIREGINLEITKHYFSDDQLIDWCSENTLNCFFYTRNNPGLAATPDQAIMSGAPLAVSDNTTFRHIHKYIKPYTETTLKDLILTSQDGIQKMQNDWNPDTCASKLNEIISK